MQTPLSTRISIQTAQALLALAKATGTSQAAIVEAALVEYIAKQVK
ncbi:MAG: hypothetical protein WC749_02480 [Dehalococcoidia bacterium]